MKTGRDPSPPREDKALYEKTLTRRTLFRGRVVDLRVDTVQLPSGRTSIREIVVHRGAVAVVALFDDGCVALVRQFRQAAGEVLLEIPAGTLEIDEDPEACARRELVEETGLLAGRIEKLFSSFLAPGYSTELLHVFLARDLDPIGADPDVDETIELVPTPLPEAVQCILDGRIRDAKTICAVLLVERRVRDRMMP